MSTTKKTKGRRKIEIKKIEKQDEKMVAFSKRKAGIYKKSCELATLTGAQILFGGFSPAGKPFSFSHPSVDAIANRFFGQEPDPINSATQALVEAQRQARINQLARTYNEHQEQLDEEKKKAKQLEQKLKGKEDINSWWNTPIEEQTSLPVLFELEEKFKNLLTNLEGEMNKRNNGASSSSVNPLMNLPMQMANPFAVGAFSSSRPLMMNPPGTMVNPFAPGPSEFNPQVFPPSGGGGYGRGLF